MLCYTLREKDPGYANKKGHRVWKGWRQYCGPLWDKRAERQCTTLGQSRSRCYRVPSSPPTRRFWGMPWPSQKELLVNRQDFAKFLPSHAMIKHHRYIYIETDHFPAVGLIWICESYRDISIKMGLTQSYTVSISNRLWFCMFPFVLKAKQMLWLLH